MIGTFYSINGELVDKSPLKLHRNFYRAILEAREAIDGELISIAEHWALVGSKLTEKPVRVLVSKE